MYYVYFPKDTGHKYDWEGITVQFRQNGGDTYVRDTVVMEQGTFTTDRQCHLLEKKLTLLSDGKHKHIGWNDVNDTFDK